MTRLVVDASVAVKWVVEESETDEALLVRRVGTLVAPDLLFAECANVLWKKVRRSELNVDEAKMAARLLRQAGVEITSTTRLMESALQLAVQLDHPAYDCVYLALAMQLACPLVTADSGFRRKVRRISDPLFEHASISINEAAALASFD